MIAGSVAVALVGGIVLALDRKPALDQTPDPAKRVHRIGTDDVYIPEAFCKIDLKDSRGRFDGLFGPRKDQYYDFSPGVVLILCSEAEADVLSRWIIYRADVNSLRNSNLSTSEFIRQTQVMPYCRSVAGGEETCLYDDHIVAKGFRPKVGPPLPREIDESAAYAMVTLEIVGEGVWYQYEAATFFEGVVYSINFSSHTEDISFIKDIAKRFLAKKISEQDSDRRE